MEMLDIYEPGDLFGTLGDNGDVRVWRVDPDGQPIDATAGPL